MALSPFETCWGMSDDLAIASQVQIRQPPSVFRAGRMGPGSQSLLSPENRSSVPTSQQHREVRQQPLVHYVSLENLPDAKVGVASSARMSVKGKGLLRDA